MPRAPNPIPSRKLTLMLPQTAVNRLEIYLWSELENRVPQGAYQQFFTARINEFFEHKQLDLAPWLGTPPGAMQISGNAETLSTLITHLNKERIV